MVLDNRLSLLQASTRQAGQQPSISSVNESAALVWGALGKKTFAARTDIVRVSMKVTLLERRGRVSRMHSDQARSDAQEKKGALLFLPSDARSIRDPDWEILKLALRKALRFELNQELWPAAQSQDLPYAGVRRYVLAVWRSVVALYMLHVACWMLNVQA